MPDVKHHLRRCVLVKHLKTSGSTKSFNDLLDVLWLAGKWTMNEDVHPRKLTWISKAQNSHIRKVIHSKNIILGIYVRFRGVISPMNMEGIFQPCHVCEFIHRPPTRGLSRLGAERISEDAGD